MANVPAVVLPTRPVISVPQPGMIYHPPPSGMAYGQLPTVTTPVSILPGHHVPVQLTANQPQHLPVNYVVPNGASIPPQPPGHVLGKGVQNDLTHILNPKMPLPGNLFFYLLVFIKIIYKICMCMLACVHTCMQTICRCMDVFAFVHVSVCVCVCMCMCAYVCISVCVFVWVVY